MDDSDHSEQDVAPDVTFERLRSDKPERCAVCGKTSNLHKYDGEHYCQSHLNARLAREGGSR